MINTSIINYRTVTALFASVSMGFLLLAVLPVLERNQLFMVALPLILLAFLILVVKPKETLVLLFMVRPLLDNYLNKTRIDSSSDGVGIGAGLNLAIIILAVFLAFREGGFSHRHKTVKYWIIFLIFMLAATVHSPFFSRAIRLYFNYISFFAMFLIPFLVIKTRRDFLFWLKLFAWSFVLPVFFGNIDMIHGGHYYQDAGNRIIGSFTYPTILGFYLVLGFTLYFYILKSGYFKLSLKVVWAMRVLMANMVVLMIATKTRNAWIAFAAIFFIYGILKDKKLLIMLCLLLPLSYFVPTVQERVLTVVSDKQANDYKGMNSFEWRLRMWKSSFPFIARKPLQGYGLTSFKPLSQYFPDAQNIGYRGAHNVYIEMLFESGIFGLLSFLALVFSPLFIFLKNMFQAPNQSQARLWAIVVGYMASFIIILSADNLTYYLVLDWYIWFFIGLMIVSKQFMEPDLKPVPER